jgi:polysaccharide biosynthesis protein PelD
MTESALPPGIDRARPLGEAGHEPDAPDDAPGTGADPSHDASSELGLLVDGGHDGEVASDTRRMVRAVVESVVLTLAFPALGYLLDRSDPFFLARPFPWIVFAPLLVGLRHGFAPGCTSAFLLAGALIVAWRARVLGVVAFPAESALGLVALAMLTGQFSDVWRRETRRLAASVDQLRRRAAALAQGLFLMNLSHERLREESAGMPNLHDALSSVREAAAGADGSWASIADAMMAIFAAYAMLEVGVVVRIDAHARSAGTIASIGAADRVDDDDALLVEAARSRTLVYQPRKGASGPGEPWSRLLAAVPFVDTRGEVSAVLCVQSMAFAAFHKKNLEALAVLAGHFADLVARGAERSELEEARWQA